MAAPAPRVWRRGSRGHPRKSWTSTSREQAVPDTASSTTPDHKRLAKLVSAFAGASIHSRAFSTRSVLTFIAGLPVQIEEWVSTIAGHDPHRAAAAARDHVDVEDALGALRLRSSAITVGPSRLLVRRRTFAAPRWRQLRAQLRVRRKNAAQGKGSGLVLICPRFRPGYKAKIAVQRRLSFGVSASMRVRPGPDSWQYHPIGRALKTARSCSRSRSANRSGDRFPPE